MTQKYIFEVIPTKTNLSTLKVNQFFLHSRYNPQKEAEQFGEENYSENHLHILFGCGLGYFAEALLKKFNENDRLLIIDPLFKQHNEITAPKGTKIIYDINKKELEFEMNKTLGGYVVKVKVICSPNYDKLLPEEYKLVLRTIQEVLKINILQRNTINFFAETWQENYVRNLIHISNDESLSILENKFDFPVIIASGGPSLVKQIPQLKEIRNKVILIASGSTINTLLHYNVEPDFIISIDGSENNFNHFRGQIFRNSYFIYSIRNHFKIRDQFKNKAFSFIPSIEPEVQHHLEKITKKNLPMLVGGTSVANYALTIALYISKGKIALIGQDLAYTDNKTHAEHNKYSQKIDENYKKTKGTFLIEGYNGDEVLTDTPLLSMKKDFEQIAGLSKEQDRLFNCTEGGVRIAGFTQCSFNEFCEGLKSLDVNIMIENKLGYSDVIGFCDRIKDELSVYKKLVRQLEKAVELIEGNKNEFTFDEKVIKGLNRIDKETKKIFENVSMNSIVDPITLDTLNNFLPNQSESREEEFERVYSQNKQLYTRLLHGAKLTKQYTEELWNEVTKNRG